MNNNLLKRIAEKQSERHNSLFNEQINLNDDNFIPFEFEGKNYFLALRDNALVFDSDKVLLYTIDYDTLSNSNTPIFSKVNEIVKTVKLRNDNTELIRLGVRREGTQNSIFLTSKFDAVFIFKKLKRVAQRPTENIEEIVIEKDGVILERYAPGKKKGFLMFNKSTQSEIESSENLSFVSTLVRVEDLLESMISKKVNNISAEVNKDNIEKCIELLKRAKEEL